MMAERRRSSHLRVSRIPSTVWHVTQEFRLPDIGEGLTEADIIEWFVAVGDDIVVDQAIVENLER
jgi:hypothetical protein